MDLLNGLGHCGPGFPLRRPPGPPTGAPSLAPRRPTVWPTGNGAGTCRSGFFFYSRFWVPKNQPPPPPRGSPDLGWVSIWTPPLPKGGSKGSLVPVECPDGCRARPSSIMLAEHASVCSTRRCSTVVWWQSFFIRSCDVCFFTSLFVLFLVEVGKNVSGNFSKISNQCEREFSFSVFNRCVQSRKQNVF